MFGFGDAQDNYNQVYQDDNKAEFSHELLAGGASFMAMKMFEDKQRKEGQLPYPSSSHDPNMLTPDQTRLSPTVSQRSCLPASLAVRSTVLLRRRAPTTLTARRPSVTPGAMPSSSTTSTTAARTSTTLTSRRRMAICRTALVVGRCAMFGMRYDT